VEPERCVVAALARLQAPQDVHLIGGLALA
jgi:hypothetical protein